MSPLILDDITIEVLFHDLENSFLVIPFMQTAVEGMVWIIDVLLFYS